MRYPVGITFHEKAPPCQARSKSHLALANTVRHASIRTLDEFPAARTRCMLGSFQLRHCNLSSGLSKSEIVKHSVSQEIPRSCLDWAVECWLRLLDQRPRPAAAIARCSCVESSYPICLASFTRRVDSENVATPAGNSYFRIPFSTSCRFLLVATLSVSLWVVDLSADP